jgi:hypothetical protein
MITIEALMARIKVTADAFLIFDIEDISPSHMTALFGSLVYG